MYKICTYYDKPCACIRSPTMATNAEDGGSAMQVEQKKTGMSTKSRYILYHNLQFTKLKADFQRFSYVRVCSM